MASNGAISPLKIQKSTPTASPAKTNGSSLPRALAEISPMEKRRNSPSYNQVTKQMVGSGRDSSPFDSSPYGASSPRTFWQRGVSPARFGSENNFLERSDSSASVRRPSIEKLKQASRVTNSSMFAREATLQYDPTSVPVIERPLAAKRPLSQLQGNAFGARGIEGERQESNTPFKGHRRGESQSKIPFLSPTKAEANPPSTGNSSPATSPTRSKMSPSKSSLSNRNTFPRGFDPNTSIWSDEDDTEMQISPPRALRRQAKSVTFDTAPPEINEYEMVTPDPSSVTSGSREGSYDLYDDDDDYEIDLGGGPNEDEDSFDASLEDTEKTPVVLPEDWRHMSPEAAHASITNTFEDPFNADKDGRSTPSQQWNAYRHASVNSDGDTRPLPPVPPFAQEERPGSSGSMSSVIDRVHAAHARSLPTPPRAAAISKSDILGMKKESSMSLEDRLRLMGLQDATSPKDSAAKEAARLRKHGLGIHVQEEEVDPEDDDTQIVDLKIPHISRESILRKVQSRTFEEESTNRLDSFAEEPSYGDLDPDVPIPSREVSSNFDEDVPDVPVKEEEGEALVDLYSIPALYGATDDFENDDFNREGSVIRHDISGHAEDENGHANGHLTANAQQGSNRATNDEGPATPKQEIAIRTSIPRNSGGSNESDRLPELSILDDGDFQTGLATYLSNSSTPPPPPEKDSIEPVQHMSEKHGMESVRDYFRRETSQESEVDEPGTPDSVVHRPIAPKPKEDVESPSVPEPVATVKAPGGKLKTRPSATPADLATMAQARRQVSGEEPPPVPEKSPKRLSISLDQINTEAEGNADSLLEAPISPTKPRQSFLGLEKIDDSFGEDISFGLDKEFDRVIESSKVLLFPSPSSVNFSVYSQLRPEEYSSKLYPNHEHHVSYNSKPLTPTDLTPNSKKGYLMRQNTKVVVAKRNFSNETGAPMSSTEQRPSSANSGSRSAGSSPRKPSHERSKSWTTEPWNGKVRRKSIRSLSGNKKAPASGPVPPMPGQESVVSAGLDTVLEDQGTNEEDDLEDGIERGRLFVKVVGVKELDLPLPKNERTHFQLTLDNGLHCVTTSWLELGRTAPIGQEFELVVLNDLEFQLTLQTKLTPPPRPVAPRATSPTKSPAKATPKSKFGNFLMSPKKRRVMERLAKEEELEAQRIAEKTERDAQQASRTRPNANATAWELLNELVGQDGSFGRAYVCLKNHEEQCFGRPIVVDMPVFNEWALEDASIASSIKSKRGGVVRRPPYQVGKLTLQLLYVPRPKNVSEEDMPKSMNACIRDLKEAEEADKREYEGFMSQQGGDCPFWRRRYFRLVGSKLTAYHEATRQPRAKIDLAKAVKIIDDKSSLVSNPEGGKSSKSRRKSAFAEEDEGYQFVEEGFRIRFANGETIDFYADKAEDKVGWMEVLCRTVGKSSVSGQEWCKVVLAREKKNAVVKTKAASEVHTRPQSADGPASRQQKEKPSRAPINKRAVPLPTPRGNAGAGAGMPSTPARTQRDIPRTPQTAPQPGRLSERRKQVRSMMF